MSNVNKHHRESARCVGIGVQQWAKKWRWYRSDLNRCVFETPAECIHIFKWETLFVVQNLFFYFYTNVYSFGVFKCICWVFIVQREALRKQWIQTNECDIVTQPGCQQKEVIITLAKWNERLSNSPVWILRPTLKDGRQTLTKWPGRCSAAPCESLNHPQEWSSNTNEAAWKSPDHSVWILEPVQGGGRQTLTKQSERRQITSPEFQNQVSIRCKPKRSRGVMHCWMFRLLWFSIVDFERIWTTQLTVKSAIFNLQDIEIQWKVYCSSVLLNSLRWRCSEFIIDLIYKL